MNAHSDARMDDGAEQALIARAKEGDRVAYECLLEPTVRSATRLAFAMLHDRSEAEDAFQESALRAWRRLRNLREGSRFQPWFIGIVANQCREIRRGRWWQLVRVPEATTSQTMDEASWLEGEDLRRAVMDLPYDQRAAILLHFHLDMPLSEVAIALGISSGGVKTRINRALKRLRPAMDVSEVRVNG
jgi:RNA polymerase sigma-70 factor, ECF subfamily